MERHDLTSNTPIGHDHDQTCIDLHALEKSRIQYSDRSSRITANTCKHVTRLTGAAEVSG